MGTTPVQLSRFIHGVSRFQELSVVNATVMDMASVDAPLLVFSKNKEERKERLFRQAVALGFTFVLAPLMAIGIAKLCGRLALSPARLGGLDLRKLGINPAELLFVPHANLSSVPAMQTALVEQFGTKIGEENLRTLMPALDQHFRETLIKAKTSFLAWGMASQGMFWATLGWIKNAFSKEFITGSDQFSGERGVVSQEKLDRLYRQEKSKSGLSKNWRVALCASAGILLPFAVASGVRRVLLTPQATGSVMKFVADCARHIDFKHWKGLPYLSLPAFAVLSILNDVAESVTARSRREGVENLIVKGVTDSLFFGGTGLWMYLFSGLVFGKNRPPLSSMLEVSATQKWAETLLQEGRAQIQQPAKFVQSMAKRSAVSYLGCFALNAVVLASALALVNRYTRNKVLQAAQALEINPEKSNLQKSHEATCLHHSDQCLLSRFALPNR